MSEPALEVPAVIDWVRHGISVLPTANDLCLDHDGIHHLQTSGRKAGLSTLNAFLYERGEPYQKGISNPVTGNGVFETVAPSGRR